MRRATSFIAIGFVLGLLPAAPSQASSPSASLAGPVVVAAWEMSEDNGDPLMLDSSGHGNHGVVGDDALAEGLSRGGGIYSWSLRCPSCPPAAPSRVVQVPDSDLLDVPDPSVGWTAEIRFKTPKGYGNLMQKGQARSPGGQFKFEHPGGRARCVWIGSNGYFDLRSTIQTNDNKWHVAQCVHNQSSIEMWIDGVKIASRNVRTGAINNTKPFVVGGKSRCDNVQISCDYYTGQIDYIRITRGAQPPDPDPTDVSFVSSVADANGGSARNHRVTVPAGTQDGDTLLLSFSRNGTDVPIDGPAGWSQIGAEGTSRMATRIWTTTATGGSAGDVITVTTGSWVRGLVSLQVYRGARPPTGSDVTTAAETVNRSAHTTRGGSVTVSGSWVVSVWSDKTSDTTSWTAPAGQVVRMDRAGSGGGHVSMLVTDGGRPEPSGASPGLTATANSSSRQATMATVVLRPAG